ncbi:hypothetical protein BCR34DRAFT_597093 [Clohesyomyces aquaticus]|uniref:Uncharacterized protein n=1 Tax=Clohesyomyces aquaticus TaxID=1231657 RepID=A0A1Y2A451_9PLEO|nr:hypothetical protein BCR34DRAFT_597093 [Clohesyomyces aquaticus]
MKSFISISLLLTLATANPILSPRQPFPSESTDPRYTCLVASDCAIVNHGNCCGYYPVCAASAAVFTQQDACPDPSHSVGVCGYPEIRRCGCQAGVCVAVR